VNPPPPSRLRRLLWSPIVGLAALLFVLEEWLWETLQRLMHLLGRLPGIRQLEGWISRLPPAGAAVFFVLPSSLALPVKLIALHLIAQGEFLRGTLVIIAAKVVATALFARLYVLTQPALMRVRWFVAVRAAVLRWRDWAYRQIESHPAWRAMRRAMTKWRAYLETRPGRFTRRWRAMQRLDRMRKRNCGTAPRA
jgi:hypothetical protein